jgi:hypothetical protein
MRFIPSNYKDIMASSPNPQPEPIVEHIPLEDMEGEMVISQCKTIIEKATEILKMMKPETQLEAWVQSKITVADDYIGSVYDYLKSTPGSKE